MYAPGLRGAGIAQRNARSRVFVSLGGFFGSICIVRSVITKKQKSSIRGWRAKDSRFAAAANV
jgi:hypothetical protein